MVSVACRRGTGTSSSSQGYASCTHWEALVPHNASEGLDYAPLSPGQSPSQRHSSNASALPGFLSPPGHYTKKDGLKKISPTFHSILLAQPALAGRVLCPSSNQAKCLSCQYHHTIHKGADHPRPPRPPHPELFPFA